MPEVPIPELEAVMLARARAMGFPGGHAALLVDHFLDAELRGATGHGVERLRWVAGLPGLDPAAGGRLVERADGLARYDGGGALGYLALAGALEAELADPPAGARLVVVRRCFPTGRLGYFAERAAVAGLACLLVATSTPRIVHPEGGPPVLGTNPFCLALPDAPCPAVIDVATSRVTYGAVLKAAADGRDLPPGAAVAADGSPVADPARVIANAAGLVAIGGDQAHKGFALAAVVELLCGALAGDDGHAAVALLAVPAAAPAAGLRAALDGRRFPGERSREALDAARRRGTVTIPDDLWAWLRDGA
jgi:LDH2 family malate/lactate/ureidoglycolate dehydrogenase